MNGGWLLCFLSFRSTYQQLARSLDVGNELRLVYILFHYACVCSDVDFFCNLFFC